MAELTDKNTRITSKVLDQSQVLPVNVMHTKTRTKRR